MAKEDFQISNSDIDSGNWIDLKGATFSPAYKRHNEAKPLDGITGSNLPEGDRIGIDVPIITIRGIINVNDFDSDTDFWSITPSTTITTYGTGLSNASQINAGYLQALWKSNAGQTKIKLKLGNPGQTQKTWKNWSNDNSEIYVVVDTVTPVPAADSEGNHIIDYTITCREVNPDGTFVS